MGVTDVDLSRLPTGQLSWGSLVEYTASSDDRVERYFLEVKSSVDLNTSSGRAKVAKLILGAANRDPAKAATRFGGHAVLLLGVGQGAATGVAPFEAMDLARYVSRIIGADGPGWDFERIPSTEGLDVIAVHVEPPTGDVWTCRADADGLTDGSVYVRADGETRRATGDELRLMLERMKSKAPDVDLDVSIEGVVHGVIVNTQFLTDAIHGESKRLTNLAPPPKNQYGIKFANLGLESDQRSRSAYSRDIEAWQTAALADPVAGPRDLVSHARDGIRLRVENHTSRYLRGVRIEIGFDAPISAADWNDPDDLNYVRPFPRAPKDWGTDTFASILARSSMGSSALRPVQTHGIVQVAEESPASLVMEMDDLRPRETFRSDADDVVLTVIADEVAPGTVHGRWRMTAEDVHEVFSGQFEVALEVSDWRDQLRRWRHSDEDDASDT